LKCSLLIERCGEGAADAFVEVAPAHLEFLHPAVVFARDILHRLPRFLGQRAKLVEVRAEDLHRNVGACAAQHVVNAVGDGLADGDVHARHLRQGCPECLQKFSLVPVFHLDRHVQFRSLDALRVLVEFSSARAARDGNNFGMSLFIMGRLQ
jgi:hypothetical protein